MAKKTNKKKVKARAKKKPLHITKSGRRDLRYKENKRYKTVIQRAEKRRKTKRELKRESKKQPKLLPFRFTQNVKAKNLRNKLAEFTEEYTQPMFVQWDDQIRETNQFIVESITDEIQSDYYAEMREYLELFEADEIGSDVPEIMYSLDVYANIKKKRQQVVLNLNNTITGNIDMDLSIYFFNYY